MPEEITTFDADDFCDLLDRLGWGPARAARELAVSRSYVQKCMTGERTLTGPIVPLLVLHSERLERNERRRKK